MLGDELKKSLEPIQASDELLEKTKRAIEAARIQQAQETLEKAEKASARRSARSSLFLKAMIPVACALLICGGLIVILPKIMGDKEKSGNKSRMPIQEHNSAINEVTAEIDAILGDDDYKKGEKTTSYAAFEESETEADSYGSMMPTQGTEVYEETTTSADNDGENSETVSEVEMYKKKISNVVTIEADGHTISVSKDGSTILVDNQLKQKLGPDRMNISPDTSRPGTGTRISGLSYDEETKMVYVTIADYEDPNYPAGVLYLYEFRFENGNLIMDHDPEPVYMQPSD
ncbi:MAG: hypothetical protein IKH92_05940 [Clostridiales bacterium]|nr:hypothetical protein [Clostridiales bacterium]